MREPEKALGAVAAKWFRIGQRIARLERSNEFQREMIEWQKAHIQSLEEELLRLRPDATKWGWLRWTLLKSEVVSVRMKTTGERNLKYTRNLIQANLCSNFRLFPYRSRIHHVGGYVFDVSRGASWLDEDVA